MAQTNVNLIDPNEVISELPQFMNGTPDYEKMHLFVELTAERKARTVLRTTSTGTFKDKTGFEEDIRISMMGYDQSKENTEHTTRWTNNTSISGDNYEGFGITKIDINTNSSFIPKVNIEFIDIRGNSFAQTSDSKYKILFDFPPPIYRLTIKGYYGKALSYELHLVKYNIKFESNTGNFHISAKFVARTFAPLTDLLFKYVETFPLIEDNTTPISPLSSNNIDQVSNNTDTQSTSNSDVRVRPQTTYQLIDQLKSLYDKISIAKDTSQEAKDFKNAQKRNTNIKNFVGNLQNFKNEYGVNELIKEKGIFIIKNEEVNENEPNLRIINSLTEYNAILKTTGTETISDNVNQKLLIAFPIGDLNNDGVFVEDINKSKKVSSELAKIRKSLLNDASDIKTTFRYSNESSFIKPVFITDKTDSYGLKITDEQTGIKYKSINITRLYSDIYRIWGESVNTLNNKQNQLVGKINDIAYTNLGMRPTIYNIFKIICDDIDRFFNKIKNASINAERHHKEYENRIITNSQIKDKKITAFPLFVSGETVCNVRRESKRMPTVEGIGQQDLPEFPEAELVNRFMDAFIRIEKNEKFGSLKSQEDVEGNNKWIPITAADSTLYDQIDDQSPYYNLFNSANSIDSVFNIFLNRFYIQTQFTFGYDFFKEEGSILPNQKNLIEFLARSEAVNIANSISETSLINSLKTQIENYKSVGYLNGFTSYLQQNLSSYSELTNENALMLTNGTDLYRDRLNINYVGLKIYYRDEEITKNIATRTGQDQNTDKPANPIDNFIFSEESSKYSNDFQMIFGKLRKWLGIENNSDTLSNFTKENIPYFPDIEEGDDFETLYLMGSTSPNFGTKRNDFNNILESNLNVDDIISQCSQLTEEVFEKKMDVRKEKGNFMNIWKKILFTSGNDIVTFLNETGPDGSEETFELIQNVIIASNFLRTVGYFNKYGDINKIMKYPAIVEVPFFSSVYMGGLIKISKSIEGKQRLVDFLNSELGKKIRFQIDDAGIELGATYILYDLDKISLLSENDKDMLEETYDYFLDTYSLSVKNDIKEMVNKVKIEFKNEETSWFDFYRNTTKVSREQNKYVELMSPSGEYKKIGNILNNRIYLLNLTQFTFHVGSNAVPTTYTPLSELITDTTKLQALNDYFNAFFPKLEKTLKKTKEDIKELENKFQSNINDNDIKTQTYYSFKNINDKWVAGQNNNIYGFPFNYDGRPLISKFAFVDRAMNPIGDQIIINAEPLIDMSKDYDLSVFTVLSRILAHNGFEFFPLQNFMAYTEDEWKKTFHIQETVQNQLAVPSFVCMYIGGTSSFLNNSQSEYDDDGLDLDNLTDVKDFGATPCGDATEVMDKPQVSNRKKYPYSEVRAFRVRYAEQNQSLFTNIHIDSREYPETNESLAILSKIAQDESSSSPVPKAQNLYNTYETRAYSAKVEMLGDAMIQPTQYFQLENIPIFSGAYVILSVEHNIVPNFMTTSFNGVKVTKFPNPFVKEFATVVGLNSGTSEDISGGQNQLPPQPNTYGQAGSASLPVQAQHNSMYTLKIKPEPIDLIAE